MPPRVWLPLTLLAALVVAWPTASTLAHDPPAKAQACHCDGGHAGRFQVVEHSDGDVQILDSATGVLYVTRGRETVDVVDPVQAVILTRALDRRDERNGRVIVPGDR